MATFDVCESTSETITEIVFSKGTAGYECIPVASKLRKNACYDNYVDIVEGDDGDFIRVVDKQHALNLIKALNKAIELGWLK